MEKIVQERINHRRRSVDSIFPCLSLQYYLTREREKERNTIHFFFSFISRKISTSRRMFSRLWTRKHRNKQFFTIKLAGGKKNFYISSRELWFEQWRPGDPCRGSTKWIYADEKIPRCIEFALCGVKWNFRKKDKIELRSNQFNVLDVKNSFLNFLIMSNTENRRLYLCTVPVSSYDR